MKRYRILDAKCGISEGGVACGPVEGNVVATVKYSDGVITKWLTNVEVTGIPNFYISEEDYFEKFIVDDESDEEFNSFLNENVTSFEGIELGDYDDIVDIVNECVENPASILLKYVIALTRCDIDEIEELMHKAVGHYVDEIYSPGDDEEDVDEFVSCFL